MRHDILSDVLSTVKNGERVGKKFVMTPASKLAKSVLSIMQEHKYIGSFELIDDGRGGKFKIELIKQINDCGTIRPRFTVRKNEYEKWERRFLPAAGFGLLIISAPKGVLSHTDAKKQNTGGRLLAYIY